jgi:hypothetical protein
MFRLILKANIRLYFKNFSECLQPQVGVRFHPLQNSNFQWRNGPSGPRSPHYQGFTITLTQTHHTR